MKKYEEILRGVLNRRLNTMDMQIGVSSSRLDTWEILLELPKDPLLGDLAFPCFSLAKQMKKSPAIIANELKA